ncbi:hypothetical protein JW756_00600 [Candidatus Woesearchaeota archaeon]|nr:hypothetical protein [Candidatus Woesearchaeota archaeon]
MKINKHTLKYLFFSLLLIITVPGVFAYTSRTGISPLNRAIEMISNLFNIEVLKNNQTVQIGFLKFMLFIVLFSVANMSLKKVKFFEHKTAGIVSFAFSMIGVFMMPYEWMLATGGLITVIMSSAIFLGFFLGLSYLAVFKFNKNWLQNLIGLLILLLLLFLIDEWALVTGLPMMFIIRKEWLTPGKNKK